jgi:hypothetical protein
MTQFTAWESFYVIVGSSAGALTGLQFVVITLIAQTPGPKGAREVAAFGTPTIVHLCAVLLTSAILSAPWPTLSSAGVALGTCGVLGAAYVGLVIVLARRQTGYQPQLEDWLWHCVFPFLAYATLLIAAVGLPANPASALFAVAAASLLLLFDGIHNAWDTVTYVAVELPLKSEQTKDEH